MCGRLGDGASVVRSGSKHRRADVSLRRAARATVRWRLRRDQRGKRITDSIKDKSFANHMRRYGRRRSYRPLPLSSQRPIASRSMWESYGRLENLTTLSVVLISSYPTHVCRDRTTGGSDQIVGAIRLRWRSSCWRRAAGSAQIANATCLEFATRQRFRFLPAGVRVESATM